MGAQASQLEHQEGDSPTPGSSDDAKQDAEESSISFPPAGPFGSSDEAETVVGPAIEPSTERVAEPVIGLSDNSLPQYAAEHKEGHETRSTAQLVVEAAVKPTVDALQVVLEKNFEKIANKVKLLGQARPDLTMDLSELGLTHAAVLLQDADLLERALQDLDVDVNATANGITPLYLAAFSLYLSGVKVLLEHPETLVNGRTGDEQQTALMVAVATAVDDPAGKRIGVIRALLDDGRCLLNQQDKDDWTALTYAARTGNTEAGRLLLSENRASSYSVKQLLNACRIAYLSGHEVFCKVLMENITRAQCSGVLREITTVKEGSTTTPLSRELLKDAQKWLAVRFTGIQTASLQPPLLARAYDDQETDESSHSPNHSDENTAVPPRTAELNTEYSALVGPVLRNSELNDSESASMISEVRRAEISSSCSNKTMITHRLTMTSRSDPRDDPELGNAATDDPANRVPVPQNDDAEAITQELGANTSAIPQLTKAALVGAAEDDNWEMLYSTDFSPSSGPTEGEQTNNPPSLARRCSVDDLCRYLKLSPRTTHILAESGISAIADLEQLQLKDLDTDPLSGVDVEDKAVLADFLRKITLITTQPSTSSETEHQGLGESVLDPDLEQTLVRDFLGAAADMKSVGEGLLALAGSEAGDLLPSFALDVQRAMVLVEQVMQVVREAQSSSTLRSLDVPKEHLAKAYATLLSNAYHFTDWFAAKKLEEKYLTDLRDIIRTSGLSVTRDLETLKKKQNNTLVVCCCSLYARKMKDQFLDQSECMQYQSGNNWHEQSGVVDNLFSDVDRFCRFAAQNHDHSRASYCFYVDLHTDTVDNNLVQTQILGQDQLVNFEMPSPPVEVKHKTDPYCVTSAQVSWREPTRGASNINSYVCYFRCSDREENWKSLDIEDAVSCSVVLRSLVPDSLYEFFVRGVCVAGFTEGSEVRRIPTPTVRIPAPAKLLKTKPRNVFRTEDPRILEPNYTVIENDNVTSSVDNGVIKFHQYLGKVSASPHPTAVVPASRAEDLTILLIGESGVGKSTLINATANYIGGVRIEHDFRFRVVHDSDSSTSRTRDVTVYSFPYNIVCPGTISIIDTPGFSDTGGLAVDQKVEQLLTDFLLCPPMANIKAINAIGIVVKGSTTNVDLHLQYVLERVLALFGQSLTPNIVWLATFADTDKPAVFRTIDDVCKLRNWPCKNKLPFNNSAWFTERNGLLDFSASNFKFGHDAVKRFFETVKSFPPATLHDTRLVLKDRLHLKLMLESIKEDIRDCFWEIENQQQLKAQLQGATADLENGICTEILITKKVKTLVDPSPSGNLYCSRCEKTCHARCQVYTWGWFGIPSTCEVFVSGKCSICPNHCVPAAHSVGRKSYDMVPSQEKRSLEEVVYTLEQEFEANVLEYPFEVLDKLNKLERAKNFEKAFQQVGKRIENLKDETKQKMLQAREVLKRLEKNGFQVHSSKSVMQDYLADLLAKEERLKTPGWEDRVKHLQDCKRAQDEMDLLADDNYDPFAENVPSSRWQLMSVTNFTNSDDYLEKRNKKSLLQKILARARTVFDDAASVNMSEFHTNSLQQ
ncbi:hypothetical protein RvY_00370 [Ramazzottius varieornatus]|uniref:Fibronectin type-III domain-containing protein n=1 Tax=Ramazzottius varieornatus TaxID=947166 RepID=A0A1D1UG73_RAMVA|nr:hypothetical protein RvY_00370 [Ramazzottius varieornatus]